MADAECKCSQPYDWDDRSWNQTLTMIKVEQTFSRKLILKTINFNWLQFREHDQV